MGTPCVDKERQGGEATRPRAFPCVVTRHPATKWLCKVLLSIILVGCAPPVRIEQAPAAYLEHGLPANMGLAYGRVVVRGWSPTVRGDHATSIEFRNRANGRTFTHRLNALGKFHWLLLPGNYEITDVWSGLDRVSQKARDQGIYFNVPVGSAVYLGELFIQLPSLYSNGAVSLFDDFAAATKYLHRRYSSLNPEDIPVKQLFSTPRPGK